MQCGMWILGCPMFHMQFAICKVPGLMFRNLQHICNLQKDDCRFTSAVISPFLDQSTAAVLYIHATWEPGNRKHRRCQCWQIDILLILKDKEYNETATGAKCYVVFFPERGECAPKIRKIIFMQLSSTDVFCEEGRARNFGKFTKFWRRIRN